MSSQLATKSMEKRNFRRLSYEDINGDAEIARLEEMRKPSLPLSADPRIISDILGVGGQFASCWGSDWKVRGYVEGMRIMEQTHPPSGQRCRRAQITVKSTPLSTFLALMEVPSSVWPRKGEGSLRLVQGVDDHADILGVSVHPDKTRGDTVCGGGGRGGLEILGRWRPPCPCPRMKLTLSRFWRLDDDGSYFIAMNSTSPPSSSSHPLSFPSTTTEEKKSKSKNKQGLTTVDNNVNVMIILTVAPRKDHSEFNDDLREALVTCAVQVQERDPNTSASTHSPSPSSPWSEELAEGIDAFMDSVVLQLVDLRQTLLLSENTNNNNHHPRHSHSHSDGNRTNDGIRRHEGDSNAKYSHSHTHLNNINDGKSSRTPGGGGGGSRGTGGGMSSATSPYDDSKSRSMALKKRLTTPGNTVTTTQPGSAPHDTHTSTTTS
eukprot:gene36129-46973_t